MADGVMLTESAAQRTAKVVRAVEKSPLFGSSRRGARDVPGLYTLVPGHITAVNGTAPNHTYDAEADHSSNVTVSAGTPKDRDSNFDYEAKSVNDPCQLQLVSGSWVIADAWEDQNPVDCAETEGPTVSADLITMRVFM